MHKRKQFCHQDTQSFDLGYRIPSYSRPTAWSSLKRQQPVKDVLRSHFGRFYATVSVSHGEPPAMRSNIPN
jgi:hypothetical protein